MTILIACCISTVVEMLPSMSSSVALFHSKLRRQMVISGAILLQAEVGWLMTICRR